MCLKKVKIIKGKRIRGYKYFPRADLEIDSIFQSGDFSWNTNIVLQMSYNNEYIVISLEEPGKYILSACGEPYKAGIHAFINPGILLMRSFTCIENIEKGLLKLELISLPGADVYSDGRRLCSKIWGIEKVEYQGKEYGYLGLVKLITPASKFSVADYWVIGNSIKEIKNNWNELMKDWDFRKPFCYLLTIANFKDNKIVVNEFKK